MRDTWRVTICACPDPPNFFVVDGGVPQKRCRCGQQKRFFLFKLKLTHPKLPQGFPPDLLSTTWWLKDMTSESYRYIARLNGLREVPNAEKITTTDSMVGGEIVWRNITHMSKKQSSRLVKI